MDPPHREFLGSVTKTSPGEFPVQRWRQRALVGILGEDRERHFHQASTRNLHIQSSALQHLTPNPFRSSLGGQGCPQTLSPKGNCFGRIQPYRGASSTRSLQPQNCRETTQHLLDVSSSSGRKTEWEGGKTKRGGRPGVGQGSVGLAMGPAGLTPHQAIFCLPSSSSHRHGNPSARAAPLQLRFPPHGGFGGLFPPFFNLFSP